MVDSASPEGSTHRPSAMSRTTVSPSGDLRTKRVATDAPGRMFVMVLPSPSASSTNYAVSKADLARTIEDEDVVEGVDGLPNSIHDSRLGTLTAR